MFTCTLVNLLLDPFVPLLLCLSSQATCQLVNSLTRQLTLLLCFHLPCLQATCLLVHLLPCQKAPDASRTRGLESLLYNENLRFLERSRL